MLAGLVDVSIKGYGAFLPIILLPNIMILAPMCLTRGQNEKKPFMVPVLGGNRLHRTDVNNICKRIAPYVRPYFFKARH
jgi:hypothetical protein